MDYDTKKAQTRGTEGAAVPVGANWDIPGFRCEWKQKDEQYCSSFTFNIILKYYYLILITLVNYHIFVL